MTPHCPIHVSVAMIAKAHDVKLSGKGAGAKEFTRTFYRCPVPGCAQVKAGREDGTLFTAWQNVRTPWWEGG